MAKRSAKGAGMIRKRSDGRWEARYTLDGMPKSFYTKTQKEARAKLTEILSTIDKGTYIAPTKLTVEKWAHDWYETYCKPRLKPYTLAGYDAILRNHIYPNLGAIALQDVRGIHIQKLYKKMTDENKSSKTIRNIGGVLHKLFETAKKQGYIAVNPCENADVPNVVKKEIHPLVDQEIPSFLKAIETEEYKNAFATCLFCGLREGECLGLSWRQVDFENQTILIDQQLQRGKRKGETYEIRSFTKNNRPRTIKPPAIAFEYLKDERKRQAAAKLAIGEAWSNPDDLVFTNPVGRYITIMSFYKHFKRIAASIGRPDARVHDLRHSTATIAIAAGADIKSVQGLLGHATASFTLSTYAHVSQKMMEDTADRMQAYLNAL